MPRYEIRCPAIVSGEIEAASKEEARRQFAKLVYRLEEDAHAGLYVDTIPTGTQREIEITEVEEVTQATD